jgi:ABC-2 type transport system ATP-binding protein
VKDAVIIDVKSLSKRYKGSVSYALDSLTLQVRSGEVYGFLGANGAGKSTTIRTLLNFIEPSTGTATISGLDIVKDNVALKRHVGYLAGEVALYPKATGAATLAYLQALQPIKHQAYYDELIKRFEAELDKPIQSLSKGNRQKIGIIQAFMHEPDVLILDEPTSGLDPLMQEVFYQTITECKNRGTAIFVSSHNLAEVQRMCDRVGIIKTGKLITEQNVEAMREVGLQRFTVHFGHKVPLEGLAKVAHVEAHDIDHATVTVKDLSAFLAFLSHQKVTRLISEQADLEQEFLHFYGGEQ